MVCSVLRIIVYREPKVAAAGALLITKNREGKREGENEAREVSGATEGHCRCKTRLMWGTWGDEDTDEG